MKSRKAKSGRRLATWVIVEAISSALKINEEQKIHSIVPEADHSYQKEIEMYFANDLVGP